MPSAGAALENIAPDARFITFPVTDGDSLRRPDNMQPPTLSAREVNWHRTMTMEERYTCRWRNLIGQGIAKLLDKPDKEKHCLQSFPEGYWMFDHNKGPISNVRHDLYLFGSKTVLRFRSPAEFIPHGYWLLTDPTLNSNNCGCKYCGGGGKKSQTEISEALGLPTNRGPTSVTGSTRMRIGIPRSSKLSRARGSGPIASDSPWVPSAIRKERKIEPVWQSLSLNLKLAADHTRISDLSSVRRFRVGELVWCIWEDPAHDNVRGKEANRSSPFWPAIVIDHSLQPTVHYFNSGRDSYSVLHKRLYSVLRLGAPSEEMRIHFECIQDEDSILPWHAHQEDLYSRPFSSNMNGHFYGRVDSFTLALHTAKHLVSVWAVCGRLPIKIPTSFFHRPPQQTRLSDSDSIEGKFLPNHRLPLGDHTVSARFTPPFSIPYPSDTSPPQRSPVRLVPPSPNKRIRTSSHPSEEHTIPTVSSTDTQPSQNIRSSRTSQPKEATVTETRYEGLWYGAERIWTGDVVRLCPERDAFAASLRLSSEASGDVLRQQRITPSPGATMRGVLMRVDRIFARIGEAGSKECAVAGPLYELAPRSWTDATPASTWPHTLIPFPPSSCASVHPNVPMCPWDMPQTPPNPREKGEINREQTAGLATFPLPSAPPGYILRPLLPPGLELPLPLSFIAGRFYPDLFQWSLVAPILSQMPQDISHLSLPAAAETQGVQLLSLCGLAPGRLNHAICKDVRLDNRPRMLEEAAHLAQVNLGGEVGNKGQHDMDVN